MDLIPNKAEQEIKTLFVDYWKKTEDIRVTRAQKLWDWYFNDEDRIKGGYDPVAGKAWGHIMAALSKMFRVSTVMSMNVRVMNIVPRVIGRLAKVYKKPAMRMLDGGVQREKQGDKFVDKQTMDDERYQALISASTINRKMKQAEELLQLFNTILIQPVWKQDEKCFDFFIHTPAWTVVVTDPMDFTKITAFYYPIFTTVNGVDQQMLVYWSATEHFYLDRLGNRIQVPTMADLTNPYGILPIAVFRLKDGNDVWGEGKWSLVDGNEECCVQLTNICYTSIFQAFGQMVAINTGIQGEIQVGPDRPIKIEKAGQDGSQDSTVSFASPNPAIPEVQALIDWMLRTIQNIEGITGNELSLDPTLQSGIAKIQDASFAVETREDTIPILEDGEHELFSVMRTIWNYHNAGSPITDKAEFSVRFYEPKVSKTADEKVKERQFALDNGTASRIDFIMEDNPTLSRDEAEKKLNQIVAENRQWKDEYGITNIFNQNNPQSAPAQPAQASASVSKTLNP